MDAIGRMLEAMERWADARADLRKCVEGCQYDAGYFCSREYDAERVARADVETAFRDAVREAVATPTPATGAAEERTNA